MNSLAYLPIDFKLIGEYETTALQKSLSLPLKRFDFYTKIASCENSKLELYENQNLQTVSFEEQEILLILDDLEIKKELYDLFIIQNRLEAFVNGLLLYALRKEASDIHIESQEEVFIIRFRIDGLLRSFFCFEKAYFASLASFIKLKCRLDITQNRVPQNGRFSFEHKKMNLDLRVSTMPTLMGESLVLRVLNEKQIEHSLDQLGFLEHSKVLLEQSIHQQNGMILVTGPTGSGKTTTLYALLKEFDAKRLKIITIEDPIEYHLQGVQQIPVQEKLDLGFEEILRDVLRQDPDVIMIGEIRDENSLHIALQASLTGHLVLSTLHTNDSISTINRLLDLKAKPFLIANTLKTIVAQRLLLRCCTCNSGCSACNFSGYKGRTLISEVLDVDEKIQSFILNKNAVNNISTYLKKRGFVNLKEDAKLKVDQGLTTLEELYKALL